MQCILLMCMTLRILLFHFNFVGKISFELQMTIFSLTHVRVNKVDTATKLKIMKQNPAINQAWNYINNLTTLLRSSDLNFSIGSSETSELIFCISVWMVFPIVSDSRPVISAYKS